jgi:hypothetical protein
LNTEKTQSGSLTSQHKAQLETLTLQQKKSTIRNYNIATQSAIRNFNTAKAQTRSLTSQDKHS